MINPNSELYQWGPVKGRILPVSFFALPILLKYVKVYGIFWPETLFIFDRRYMTWINDDADLRGSGKKSFNKWMLNKANRRLVENRFNKTVARLFALNGQISVKWLKSLNKNQLIVFFQKWQKIYFEFWVHGIIPEISNWGGEKLAAEILKKNVGQSEKFNHFYEVLSAPTQSSFYQKEEIELLKIAKSSGQPKIFQKKLQQHQQKYFWLLNNYYRTKVLSLGYFQERLKGVKNASAKIQSIKNQLLLTQSNKRALVKKLKLKPLEERIIESLDYGICWQDRRKAFIMEINHYLDLLLKEVARRTDYTLSELKSLLPAEVIRVLEGHKIKKSLIKSRDKFFAFFYNKRSLKYLSGREAQSLYRPFTVVKKNLQVITGLVVSQGPTVTGKARIIKSFTQLKNFKSGEILVTPMTSPEYVVAMRKAKAVITDGGSMTCHASIVSRELKVPCIVNTKSATAMFRTGDLISVNTAQGQIKKVL